MLQWNARLTVLLASLAVISGDALGRISHLGW